MSIKWPKTVPILLARDIHKGSMHSESGKKHCLIGYAVTVFPDIMAKDKTLNTIKEIIGTHCVIEWNDNPLTPKSLIAKVWNKAMGRLGYTQLVAAKDK